MKSNLRSSVGFRDKVHLVSFQPASDFVVFPNKSCLPRSAPTRLQSLWVGPGVNSSLAYKNTLVKYSSGEILR